MSSSLNRAAHKKAKFLHVVGPHVVQLPNGENWIPAGHLAFLLADLASDCPWCLATAMSGDCYCDSKCPVKITEPVFSGKVPVVDHTEYPALWSPTSHRLFSPYLRQLVRHVLMSASRSRRHGKVPGLPHEMWHFILRLTIPDAEFKESKESKVVVLHNMSLPEYETHSFVDTVRVELSKASRARNQERKQVRLAAADAAEREWRAAHSDDSGEETPPPPPDGSVSPSYACNSPQPDMYPSPHLYDF